MANRKETTLVKLTEKQLAARGITIERVESGRPPYVAWIVRHGPNAKSDPFRTKREALALARTLATM